MRWNPEGIVQLYSEFLRLEMKFNSILEQQVENGLRIISKAYKPNDQNFASSQRISVDYDERVIRCAYVHRFSSLYTGMAYELLCNSIIDNPDLQHIFQRNLLGYFKVACLGGGPGTDLVGVWSALYHRFGPFYGSAMVVDSKAGWEDTIGSVVAELQNVEYPVSEAFDPLWFDWTFLKADLLGEMSTRVKNAIKAADLVTMFKFLSAAACKDTEKMLEEIFRTMKPGALVFFINNAAGGFHRLIQTVADRCQFVTVHGPLCHVEYFHESFNVFRFFNESLWKTTVTVQILMKPYAEGFCPTFYDQRIQ